MTLTQQFLIVAILPGSFLGLAWYLWRARLRRPRLASRWLVALAAAAVWASSLLSYYGGATMTLAVGFSWRVVGNYGLSLVSFGLLLTALDFLALPRTQSRLTLAFAGLLWLLALLLDPAVWRTTLPDLALAGRRVGHYALWGAVWVTSWLLPIALAWFFAWRTLRQTPSSLRRNQISFWLLALTLFLPGGALAFNRQPGWHEMSVLVSILASLLGTLSLTRSQLPELRLGLRQLAVVTLRTLAVLGLAWLALWFVVRVLGESTNPLPRLLLPVAAATFAALFEMAHLLAGRLLRRVLLPVAADRAAALAGYTALGGGLLEPPELGQLVLKQVQLHLGSDAAWIMLAEDGPAGQLILRPLAALAECNLATVDFCADSPFQSYLRRQDLPLVQHDLDTLEEFDGLPPNERDILASWQRILYQPLRAGQRLVGLLALGPKIGGERYSNHDSALLQTLAAHLSPMLAQARLLASLRLVSDYAFQQSQTLVRTSRHQRELATLHHDFLEAISPELRRPFQDLDRELGQLAEQLDGQPGAAVVRALDEQLAALRGQLGSLIAVAGKVQRQAEFYFRPVHLDEVARNARRNLAPMAEARRVAVELVVNGRLPFVYGDERRLCEALQNVLHNAIKFNKIGGAVRLECAVQGDRLCLSVTDNGVGIPDERLAQIWQSPAAANGANGQGWRGPAAGLPLTRFIVSAHGGQVEASSKYGAGSTFSIYLPVALDADG